MNATWAKILGVVLLLFGIVGFFTGNMFVFFSINSVHNFVHILTGLIALWVGFGSDGKNATTFNRVFGIVYLLVAIVGFFNVGTVVDLLSLNAADNWLHLIIGVVTTVIGFWA